MLAGPAARSCAPGLSFGRYRTVAFDGCRSVEVPDTPRNRGWLGKLNAAGVETGYPVIQLMTLCETGTRALIGAVFGPAAGGELAWAPKLLHLLGEAMLELMDRAGSASPAGTSAALAHARPVAVVHFDAHLDTWDTFFGSAYTHGTPFRRASEEGLLDRSGCLHVGIRGSAYSDTGLDQDTELGFQVVSAPEIDQIGVSGVVERIKQRVR